MNSINSVIKMALENTVLCRGSHGPKESYEYAVKMENVIKKGITEKLLTVLESQDTENGIKKLISEING
ncbi:MAG: hypothetical protein EBZ95_11185 [Chitinophagia bacterium]|nr:hypothetical protein [Chitinophagia bacterium]